MRNNSDIDAYVYAREAPPDFVIKGMERQWADELAQNGNLRLSEPGYYRTLGDLQLGDAHEGRGRHPYGDNGGVMTMEHTVPVYLFCTSLSSANPAIFLELNSKYDTIVKINDPKWFAFIVAQSASDKLAMALHPTIGKVAYTRNQKSSFDKINSGSAEWNLFEKSDQYNPQSEYRFAFTHYMRPKELPPRGPHIYLKLRLPEGMVTTLPQEPHKVAQTKFHL